MWGMEQDETDETSNGIQTSLVPIGLALLVIDITETSLGVIPGQKNLFRPYIIRRAALINVFGIRAADRS